MVDLSFEEQQQQQERHDDNNASLVHVDSSAALLVVADELDSIVPDHDTSDRILDISGDGDGGGGGGGGSMDDDSDERDFGFTSIANDDHLLQAQVKDIVSQLSDSFQSLRSSLQRANILLVGKTGVGKSSLVNAVFGGQFAETGTGEPITRHLHRYAPENSNVVVFDTKGLEHGNHDKFIEETSGFLSSLRSSHDLRDHLHVVWYVIDMAHARFQPFEQRICTEVLEQIPVFFVLNKVDTAERAQVDAIRELVVAQRFPSFRGIFEVVSDRKSYSPSYCPRCHGTDFRFRQRTKELLCDEPSCAQTTLIGRTSGLEQLVAATTNELPQLAKYSFVNAQEVSELERVRLAREIIVDCASSVTLKRSGFTARQLVHMATHLALLWNYKFFPTLVTQEVAHHYYDRYKSKSLLGRLVLVIRDMLSSQRLSESFAVAIGVELCRILCEVKMQAVGCAMMTQDSPEIPVGLAFAFQLRDEWLQDIARRIKTASLPSAVDYWLQQLVPVCWQSTTTTPQALDQSLSSSSSSSSSSTSATTTTPTRNDSPARATV